MLELNLKIANNPAWGAFSRIGNYACVSYTPEITDHNIVPEVIPTIEASFSLALRGVKFLHTEQMTLRQKNGGKFDLTKNITLFRDKLASFYVSIGEQVTLPFLNAVLDLYIYRFWSMQTKMKHHPSLWDGEKSKYVSVIDFKSVVKEVTMNTMLTYHSMFLPYRVQDITCNGFTYCIPTSMRIEASNFSMHDEMYDLFYSDYSIPHKMFVTLHHCDTTGTSLHISFAWAFSFDKMQALGKIWESKGAEVGVNVFLYRKHHSVVF